MVAHTCNPRYREIRSWFEANLGKKVSKILFQRTSQA
jgi:hypothetical protein